MSDITKVDRNTPNDKQSIASDLCHDFLSDSNSFKDKEESLCESLSSYDIQGSSTSSCPTSPCCGSLLRSSLRSTYSAMNELITKCGNPRLQLKENPPCIFHSLPDIFQALRHIVSRHEENYDELAQIDYLPIFVRNLGRHCDAVMRLLDKAALDNYCESEAFRKQIIKHSLIMSNILADLRALFPDHLYIRDAYRVTKPDAALWWRDHFPGKVIVPWCLFSDVILTQFHVEDRHILNALKKTIDLTCNNHVSVFEFDVFVRLFQPWNNIIESWKALAIKHPGYIAYITYDEVEELLTPFRHTPGTFIYRQSCTQLGQWAIGYVAKNGEIQQTIIKDKPLAQALLDGQHNGCYLFPRGKSNCSDIVYELVHNLPQIHLQVSEEEYQTYCAVGTTFEQCKICTDNHKDTRLEPCGHLLCKICLEHHLASSPERHCPFCRSEIREIVDVVLDPYRPSSPSSMKEFGMNSPPSSAIQPIVSRRPQQQNPHQQLNHIYDRGHVNLTSKLNLTSGDGVFSVNSNNPFIRPMMSGDNGSVKTMDSKENPKILRRPIIPQLQTLTKSGMTTVGHRTLGNTNPQLEDEPSPGKTINYAELDFMQGGEGVVSSSNGLPPTTDASLSIVRTNSSGSHQTSTPPNSSRNNHRVLMALLTVDFHERCLPVPSDDELSQITSVLLQATGDDLQRAQHLLKYFQPRNTTS